MRDFLAGAVTVAAGILIAAAVLFAAWQASKPAQSITVDLAKYSCATDGKIIKCQRG